MRSGNYPNIQLSFFCALFVGFLFQKHTLLYTLYTLIYCVTSVTSHCSHRVIGHRQQDGMSSAHANAPDPAAPLLKIQTGKVGLTADSSGSSLDAPSSPRLARSELPTQRSPSRAHSVDEHVHAKKRKAAEVIGEPTSAKDADAKNMESPDILPSFEDSIWHFSGVPPTCKASTGPAHASAGVSGDEANPPCIVGIDEAGRGCVLGPMVYGAAFWAKDDDEAISKLGYDDSKGLTAEVREKMFKGIKEKEKGRIGFTTVAIPAATISAKMLRAFPYSLNKMSWACCVSMVERIIAEGVNVSMVYVDTVGDPQIYESWLKRQFNGQVDFTVRKKADSLFKVVSAASICAKQTRDHMLEDHTPTRADSGWLKSLQAEGQTNIGQSVGSGYPGDPKTKEFLAKTHDPVFGFSEWVRHSWSTCKLINKEKGVVFDWGEDDEEDNLSADSKAQSKLGSFFMRKGASADEKRSSYFVKRGMKRARVSDFE